MWQVIEAVLDVVILGVVIGVLVQGKIRVHWGREGRDVAAKEPLPGPGLQHRHGSDPPPPTDESPGGGEGSEDDDEGPPTIEEVAERARLAYNVGTATREALSRHRKEGHPAPAASAEASAEAGGSVGDAIRRRYRERRALRNGGS